MSIEAISWVLNHYGGAGNEKLVLIGIANHASPDGSDAYPTIPTLARYVGCSDRTVQRNLRALEDSGAIVREGIGPSGQTRWRLCMANPSPGDKASPPTQTSPEGVSSTSPKPSLATVQGNQQAARAEGDEVPPGFPDELRPHARHVMRVLTDLAERHGAKVVTARSLGNVIMARPRKPLVQAAHDFAAWADGKAQRQRDVVAGYRNWLNRCDDLAAVERLPGEAAAAPPANVARMTPRVQRQQARLAEIAELERRQLEGGL